jgi:hypothetical protein
MLVISVGTLTGPLVANPTNPILCKLVAVSIKLKSSSVILTPALIVFEGGKPLNMAI